MDEPHRAQNGEVARLLEEIGDLLEIKGEQGFRVNAYRNAARRIEGLREPIEGIHADGRLRSIPGVGEALAQKIAEFLSTGELAYLDRLRAEFPPGLVELLQVPGLGPRKARLIFDTLGVGNLVELEGAARAQRLRGVPGLGEKTEITILNEIERLKQRSTRHQLGWALGTAEELLAELRECPAVVRAAFAGSLRRMQDTIGNVDLVVATNRTDDAERFLLALPRVRDVRHQSSERTTILVRRGLQVDVYWCQPEHWAGAIRYVTGSAAHNRRLERLAAERGWVLDRRGLWDETGRLTSGDDEDDIYEALGLQPIPPELREDTGEVELAAERALPRLLELSDIRGDLHVHSDWSDGGASIEAMARAAMRLGREYIALTDHSKSLGVARGLTDERVVEQREVIRALNQTLSPFRIIHGTEMDIRRDGSLDYDDDTLEVLEYVSASIHSAMNQARDVMTSRIVRAIGHRHVATLNHPFGRLIGSRDAYEVDMNAVIHAAAVNGVALEINAQPARMDLESVWARRARTAGAKLVINSDSHATGQLDLIRFGVATARRAWLGPEQILNSLPLERLLRHLQTRRSNGAQ